MRPSSAQRCSVGKTFPGLNRPSVVEGAFEPLLLVEIGLGKHRRHQIALFDADAMLAGEHAADLDAEPQNIGAELFGALELARLVGVVEDQRMQVAVAGMKHIGDAQAVFRRHVLHAAEHQRQLGARDGAVHAVIVRRDAADGRERGFAAGPEQQPLLFGIGDAIRYRSTLPGDVLDAFEQMIDLGARAVEFDDQQRLDVERITGMDKFLGGMNGGAVHHLHAARNDAGADDPSDAVAEHPPRWRNRPARRARFPVFSGCAPSLR